MTTLWTKVYVAWTRLYSRFAIEPGRAASSLPTIQRTIVPVTSFDDLLKVVKGVSFAMTITATGEFAILQCPVGKRWRIMAVRSYLVGGVWTFTFLNIYDAAGGNLATLENFTATADHTTLLDGQQVLIENGQQLGLYVNAFTSLGTGTIIAWVEEENAY